MLVLYLTASSWQLHPLEVAIRSYRFTQLTIPDYVQSTRVGCRYNHCATEALKKCTIFLHILDWNRQIVGLAQVTIEIYSTNFNKFYENVFFLWSEDYILSKMLLTARTCDVVILHKIRNYSNCCGLVNFGARELWDSSLNWKFCEDAKKVAETWKNFLIWQLKRYFLWG